MIDTSASTSWARVDSATPKYRIDREDHEHDQVPPGRAEHVLVELDQHRVVDEPPIRTSRPAPSTRMPM